jgi:disulfide bond formation protein DsbB
MLFRKFGLQLAWLIAIVATIGSLFFSEVLDLPPCTYCWYQRVFLYPLVIILGIAVFRKDYSISIYALPLAMVGGLVAIFQSFMEKLLDPMSMGFCKDCILSYSTYPIFGIEIYFPYLSFVAFLAISILLFGVYKNK